MDAMYLVTGAGGGIGRATALALAEPGRWLLLSARDEQRASAVAEEVRAAGAWADAVPADLSTVRGAYELADAVAERGGPLIVIHSAGVARRRREWSADGIELTFAVQYLARYVLGWRLFGLLGPQLRGVLSIAGGGTTRGTLDLANLQGDRKYSALGAIATTSMANDLLGMRLQAAMSEKAGRSWVYGPGLVHDTGFDRDLPLPTRLAAPLIGRLAGTDAATAGARVAALAVSDKPGGLYRGALTANPRPDRDATTTQSRLLDTASQALVQAAIPTWHPSDKLHT